MTKRDLFLLGAGVCFGILMCSVMAFLLVLSDGTSDISTSTPSAALTQTFTDTPSPTNTSTATITAFPGIIIYQTYTPTITYTPSPTFTKTKSPTLVPTIRIVPTTSSNNNQNYPEGITAICNDGTYSNSQSRQGTCSRHGGVKKWINKPPK